MNKLIVIVGPTASGKTELALKLAEQVGGEIICADSRTIYRGMDIGTAKPSAVDRLRVSHHLLDIVDPNERLSAAAFKRLADAAIADIQARGKVPFLVGGSGLYVDAVVFDYQFPPPASTERRQQLEAMSNAELLELLAAEDFEALERIDIANRRRVIRALETIGRAGERRGRMIEGALMLGLSVNKEVIQHRIQHRVDLMLRKGFVSEVEHLAELYGWESDALKITGYEAFRDVALGHISVSEGVARCVRSHMALVKKQITWFKRNPDIRWLDDVSLASALVVDFLYNSRHEHASTDDRKGSGRHESDGRPGWGAGASRPGGGSS